MSDYESGYPNYMQESLKKVIETRTDRIGRRYPPMTAEERQKVLEEYHPDWKMDQKRVLKIGHNKGLMMPHEVADQIEEITRKRVERIALALKDIGAEHLDFQLAELVKLLNQKNSWRNLTLRKKGE